MSATDLGWVATVTGICPIHGETETWGVKGPTAALALDGLEGFKTDLTTGEHELDEWAPSAGKIFPMPEPPPPEPDPVEKAASAVWAELEHLSRSDRLLVLRQAISAEEWPLGTARRAQHASREQTSLATRADRQAAKEAGLLRIPPCDGGQIP